MLQIDASDQIGVARFVFDKIGDAGEFWEKFAAIGIYKNSCLIAGCVYTDFYPRCNVNMHIASVTPEWASRRTIKALLAYPFNQLGCPRVTATIRKKNKPSRSLVERLGFTLEGNMRGFYGNDDLLIYGLLKPEAKRWL